MSDALVRARVLSAVRELCSTREFLRVIEAARAAVDGPLPPHRLSQLATGFAWHAKRGEPTERLEEGAHEIARLWERAGEAGPGERGLYLLLIRKLGLEHELRQIQQRVKEKQTDLEQTVASERDPRKQRQIERDQRPMMRKLREEEELYGRALKALGKHQIANDDGRPWLDQIALKRQLSTEQSMRWRPELRLRLALAAVQTVQTLQATAELQQQVEAKQEGVFPWR
jgi:hypothetical protein